MKTEKLPLGLCLIGILNYYDGDVFPNDRPKIHRAFYQLRGEFPEYFGDIAFRKNPLYPKSERLDDLFFSMDFEGSVLSKTPYTRKNYIIDTEKARRYWEGNENNSRHSENVKKMAKRFEELMK